MFHTVRSFANDPGRRTVSTVIGVPGGGLGNGRGGAASWAANAGVAKTGQQGEQRTAAILNRLARHNGAAVLHDIQMPMAGVTANIDHIVVSGTTVTIVDSKVWKPGFYWTLANKTRRGWRRFAIVDRQGRKTYPGDKQTIAMAITAIEKYLPACGVTDFRMGQAIVIAWPSTKRKNLSLWAARFPAARLMRPKVFERKAKKVCGTDPADARIVDALSRLVVSVKRQDVAARNQARSASVERTAPSAPPAAS